MGLFKKVGFDQPHIEFQKFERKVNLNVLYRLSEKDAEKFLRETVKRLARMGRGEEQENVELVMETVNEIKKRLRQYGGDVCTLKMEKEKPNGEKFDSSIEYFGLVIKGMTALENIGKYGFSTLVFPYKENIVLDAEKTVQQNLGTCGDDYLKVIHTNSGGKYDFTHIFKVMDVLNHFGTDIMDKVSKNGTIDLDVLCARISQAGSVRQEIAGMEGNVNNGRGQSAHTKSERGEL